MYVVHPRQEYQAGDSGQEATCQDRKPGPDRKRPGNTVPLHPVRLHPRQKLLQDPQTLARRHIRHQVRHQGYQDSAG